MGSCLDRNARIELILIVASPVTTGSQDDLSRSKWVQIEISTRHGVLGPEQHEYLREKAEKLVKYFGRLMAIEVAVEPAKHAEFVGPACSSSPQ